MSPQGQSDGRALRTIEGEAYRCDRARPEKCDRIRVEFDAIQKGRAASSPHDFQPNL
jgi:hypothetical protein